MDIARHEDEVVLGEEWGGRGWGGGGGVGGEGKLRNTRLGDFASISLKEREREREREKFTSFCSSFP